MISDVQRLDPDVLIIGDGMAGLMAAMRARRSGARTLVLGLGGGASSWLQGVNVALGHADERDSLEVHAADIGREGRGVSDPGLVHDTAYGAPDAFAELVRSGVDFARDEGRFRQRHASGSTYPRCCYVPGMMWGPKARRVLHRALAAEGVTFARLRVVRLLADGGRIHGAVAVSADGARTMLVRAPAVIIASGGVGRVYAHSTYPSDVSGASYALAFRAGAELADMEFIQFEPLVAFRPVELRGYVMPTTLFGDGACLRDRNGERFLLEFRPQGEAGIGKEDLVLAMAEMPRRGRSEPDGAVWLDARAVPARVLEGYPWLYGYLLRRQIDLAQQMVAVLPAAHTCLGGVRVGGDRATSVSGLFAAGEAATGVHGAGRLAGGSGTDVIVSGMRAGDAAAAARGSPAPWGVLESGFRAVFAPGPARARRAPAARHPVLREASERMATAAGIWREERTMRDALDRIHALFEAVEPAGPVSANDPRLPLADQLMVSGMILASAIARRESRGAHQRTDFPATDPSLARSLPLPWPAGRPFAA
ncbi:MAG: FAD-binding protein [Burkholderiales bacterium]|nr:MAG: FAD-binding protein [Burkholderiales bacterium]